MTYSARSRRQRCRWSGGRARRACTACIVARSALSAEVATFIERCGLARLGLRLRAALLVTRGQAPVLHAHIIPVRRRCRALQAAMPVLKSKPRSSPSACCQLWRSRSRPGTRCAGKRRLRSSQVQVDPGVHSQPHHGAVPEADAVLSMLVLARCIHNAACVTGCT